MFLSCIISGLEKATYLWGRRWAEQASHAISLRGRKAFLARLWQDYCLWRCSHTINRDLANILAKVHTTMLKSCVLTTPECASIEQMHGRETRVHILQPAALIDQANIEHWGQSLIKKKKIPQKTPIKHRIQLLVRLTEMFYKNETAIVTNLRV